MHQGGGRQEGLGELRLDHLGRVPLRRPTLELVGMTRKVGLDRHRRDILSPLDLELCSRSQRGIDRRVQWSAARIGLVAQPLPLEDCAQIAEQHRGIVAVRLVQLEKSKAAIENVARPGKSGLCQNR